jgi:hypothetical protein
MKTFGRKWNWILGPGGRYRLAGDGVRQYAEKLRDEMERRRLQFSPIDWHR